MAAELLWPHTRTLCEFSVLPLLPECHVLELAQEVFERLAANGSIISRSRFHGLSTLEGEQIASYIRSLPVSHPGRPWNPPYQPGPGLDEQPILELGGRRRTCLGPRK